MLHFIFEFTKKNYLFPHNLEKIIYKVLNSIDINKMSKKLDTLASSKLLGTDISYKFNYKGYKIWSQKKCLYFLKYPQNYKSDDKFGIMLLAVGEYVFNLLKKEIKLDKYFPYNDAIITPHNSGQGWNISLRALIKRNVDNKDIYYSRLKATVSINNFEYIISFTTHCIKRILERMYGKNNGTYGSYGDIFEILNGKPYYEMSELKDGTNAICIFVMLNPNDINTKYYQPYIKNFDCYNYHYYRLGYFPIEISNNYAICKTLLCPGYHKTPEYSKIKEKYYNHRNLEKILNNISNYGFAEQLDDAKNNIDVFQTQKYLCNSGISQTISSDERLDIFGKA